MLWKHWNWKKDVIKHLSLFVLDYTVKLRWYDDLCIRSNSLYFTQGLWWLQMRKIREKCAEHRKKKRKFVEDEDIKIAFININGLGPVIYLLFEITFVLINYDNIWELYSWLLISSYYPCLIHYTATMLEYNFMIY